MDGQKYGSFGRRFVLLTRLQGQPHLYTIQTDMSLSSDCGLFFVVGFLFFCGFWGVKLVVAFGAFDQLASDLNIAQATDWVGSFTQTLG